MTLQSTARKVQDFSKTATDTGVKTVQAQSRFMLESLKRNNATFAELIDARLDSFYDGMTAGSFKGFFAHDAEFRATAKDKLKELYGSNKDSFQNLQGELKTLYRLDKINADDIQEKATGVVKKFTEAGNSVFKSGLTAFNLPTGETEQKASTRKAAPQKAKAAPKKTETKSASPSSETDS